MMDWISMGGYGAFVWAAFGLWFCIVSALLAWTLNNRSNVRKILKRLEASQDTPS